MSELVVYTILDKQAEAYLKPIFAVNNGVARRLFHQACNDPESDFYKYPEDYSLWRIGWFDIRKGVIESEIPECMAKAIEVKIADPTYQLKGESNDN